MTDELGGDRLLRIVHEANSDPDGTDIPDDASLDGFDDDDESLTFTGGLTKLAFQPRSGALMVTFTVDDTSPVTNRDLRHLQRRILSITAATKRRTKTGGLVSAKVTRDPVKARILGDRLDRAMAGWVTDDDEPYG